MSAIPLPEEEKSRFGKYQGFRWTVLGNSGSGKTQFLRFLIKKLIKNRYIIYDIEGEYTDCGELVHNVKELEKAITEKKNKIVFDTEQKTYEGMVDEVAYISSLTMNNEYFQKWSIIIDEAHIIYPKSGTNSSDEAQADCIALLVRGRKRGVNLALASQQLSMLNLVCVRQANLVFIMNLSENEKKYFSGYEHIAMLDGKKDFSILNLTDGIIYPPVELI